MQYIAYWAKIGEKVLKSGYNEKYKFNSRIKVLYKDLKNADR